jgi:hypothetical protein
MPWVIFLIWFASLWVIPFRAVEMNGAYNTTDPSLMMPPPGIPNWTTGWGKSTVTGWDYVGNIGGTKNQDGTISGGASGTYLGNGWVLTAGHVGAGTFYLINGPGAGTYYVTGTPHSISNYNGTADLTLFQISNPPALPSLIISVNFPNISDPVAMLGYGGGHGLTWGYGMVSETNQLVTPQGYTYVSSDFYCFYNSSVTNGTYNSTLVGGDSGGGTFEYNTGTRKWELVGINEAIGSLGEPNMTYSAFVQLNTYVNQINNIAFPYDTDSPTMPLPALLVLACLLFLFASRSLGSKARWAKRG